MTTVIDGDNVQITPTDISSTDSPYTTQDEQYIYVDTSGGAVTVTLASADAVDGQRVEVYDVGDSAGTNNITINTEGAETIDPGGESSKSITTDGGSFAFVSDGSDWFAQATKTVFNTGTVTLSGGSTPALDTVLADTLSSETQDYSFRLYVDADPAFNADYAFNYDYTHTWDDSDSAIDIDLTVNWDTDPGGSNDVTARWEVFA